MNAWKNQLFFGDNLEILRGNHIPVGSVDLIYLDPPFNSNATYNILFAEKSGEKSAAQITAFEDTWHWGDEAAAVYDDVVRGDRPRLAELLRSLRAFLGQNDMMAYLSMMAARLVELHRVLKPTGSLYLHCDPTAGHYLRILLDAVFGLQNLRNEIIWRRTGSNNSGKRFGPIHQVIFYYVKSDKAPFYQPKTPYTKDYIDKFFTEEDGRGKYQSVALTGPGIRKAESGQPWRDYNPSDVGRHWQPASYLYSKYLQLTGEDLAQYPLLERLTKLDEVELIAWGKSGSRVVPRYKFYLGDAPGVPSQDIWAYQPGTEGCIYGDNKIGIDQDVKWLSTKDKERLGYPTQKPEGILNRIIQASSKEGDLVLDPFCGCGTTITVAEHLKRRWIGIDITHLAITLIKKRLHDSFGEELAPYEVVGEPVDARGAEALAETNRHQFEWWALGLIDAAPAQDKRKGADRGVDGVLYFQEKDDGTYHKIIVQVKSGHIGAKEVRELEGTRKQEKAEIAVLLTLKPPTKPMKEAVLADYYVSALFPDLRFPRLQIFTIAELFAGRQPEYPNWVPRKTFKKAVRRRKGPTPEQQQNEFDL